MKRMGFVSRMLALLLALCTLVGLLPAVAVPGVRAEESTKAETRAVADETNAALTRLNTSYNSFTIPINKEVYNYTSLDGVYFLGHGLNRTIDFSKAPVTHKDRLTAKTNNGEAAVNYSHLWTVPITQTNGTKLDTVNGKAPTNLDYAVEIKKYTGSMTWNTTSSFEDDNGKTKKGWANYVKYEYNRSNSWCGTSTYYGKYLGIYTVPTTGDPKYSIKSLHPNRASAPYLACDNGDGEMRYKNTAFPFFVNVNSTNASVKIYKVAPGGENLYTYWLGVDKNTSNSNNYCFTAHTMSQIVREDRNKSTDSKYKNCNKKEYDFSGYNIYQVSPAPLELYRALEKAKTYVDGKNANGAYPAETYLGFLKFTESALTLYNSKRTVWSTDKNNADRVKMDDVAKDLRAYMTLLGIETKPGSYMDIPMEVLDFRADGFLFENCGGTSPYTLGSGIPGFSANAPIPGYPGTGTNGGSFRGDLIEKKLVNGQIVYREETVRYVAEALYCQYMTLSDPGVTKTTSSYDAYWNTAFMQKVDPAGLAGNKRSSSAAVNPYPLGACGYDYEANYDATIAKTSTGSPGGVLRYDQVENCFDLAYYMLTNVWRETARDDYVDPTRKLPYNLKINELSTMRMLKDSQGYYVFSSDKENGRCVNSGLIFNLNLTNSAGSSVPTLNAASDLGFESPSMLGNNSTGANEDNSAMYGRRNYHVMYHVRSTFIYYEDKNLEFTFSGDDDVYFFVNDTLVCDIGGMHSQTERGVKLNGPEAQELNLKDGDICTFDMFLVERQTSQINLNLRTNIEMMPVGIATDKVQYQYTQPGVIGEEIREGGVVADNTKVGYGFKLLNRCDHGAVDLTFKDDNLNVHLTPDALSLGGKADVGDLILIYRTYDPHSNVIYSGEPVAQSYDSFKSRLIAAVEDMSTIVPMGEGAYKLTGLTEAQIKELLRIGLPASVQISVYGFCQTVSSSVGGYTNVVNTTCRPIAYRQADGSFAYEAPLSGFATRNLNVQTLNTVTAEPLQIVIDYGKPVVFTEAEVLKCVTYDPMDVSISLKGFLKTGKHGAIVFRDPAELFLCEENSELSTDNGVYDKSRDTLRFTPIGMLEEIDRIYAMVRVDDVYLGGGWYLTVAIEIIPATLMYYEAEDLATAGELTFMEKWTEESDPNASEPETDETEPETDEPETQEPPAEETEPEETLPPEIGEDDGVRTNTQITHVQDTEDREHPVSSYDQKADYLYFGFDDTPADQQRYTDEIYGGTYHFDKAPSNDSDGPWIYHGNRTTKFEVIDGAMAVTCAPTGDVATNSPWLQTGVLDMTKNLNYPTSRAEVAWVRLKLSNLTTFIDPIYDLEQAVARLAFVLNEDATMEDSSCWVDFPLSEEQLNSSDYMTLSADITGLMADHEARRITAVRLTLINAAGLSGKTGTFRIDEIYVGPRVAQDTDSYIAPAKTVIPTAPVRESFDPTYDSSVMYFGFGNTPADSTRYTSNAVYTKKNFDTPALWKGTSGRNPTISNGALHISGESGGNSYVVFNSGTGTSDFGHLNYVPGSNDWFEVRIMIKDPSVLNDTKAIRFDVELYKNNPQMYKISYTYTVPEGVQANRYYTIAFKLPANSGGWDNTVSYSQVGTVKRIGFNPIGLKTNRTYSCAIDYIYVGPESKLPSKDRSDCLYFGFDNDNAAQTKYGSTVYAGDNFDTPGKWRYATHRSTAPTIANGMMTATVINEGRPWFETARNGTAGGYYMHFDPTNAEIVRFRVKFNNINVADQATIAPVDVFFGATVSANTTVEPVQYIATCNIPSTEVATDGKWFTYTVELNDLLSGIHRITGMRIRFQNLIHADATSTISFDYIYVGPRIDAPPEEYRRDEDYTYGWDSSYVKDPVFSDNEALYLEGRGVPVTNEDYSVNYEASSAYSEVFFSFTGTGFDLIGRTGKDQGTLRVAVYKKVTDIDGTKDAYVKSITVNTKGELELNQIPVVSVQGLDHDTYYVKIWCNDKVAPPQIPGVDLSYLARGNEFYIDAIRIYDPIDVEAETLTADEQVALRAYERDKEAYNYVKEVRNILLSKENFENLLDSGEGAVFVDMETTPPDIVIQETDAQGETTGETTVVKPDGVEVTDHVTAKVQTYNKVGPKNEVYLAPGQAVAFRLAVDTAEPIVSLDVGAKNILSGSDSTLSVGFVSDVVEMNTAFRIATATAQYYTVNTESIRYLTSGSAQEIYFVIYNSTEGDRTENVISVTDIKVAYEAYPTILPPADVPTDPEIKRAVWAEGDPIRFLVDGNTTTAAERFVKHLMDNPADTPTEEEPPAVDEAPTTVEGIRILHSLNLASDISVNYAVAKTELEGYENITLVVTRPVYEGNEYRGTETVTLMPRDQDGFLYFTLDGMTAVNMNDTVEAVLTMTKDGKAYTTRTDTYSVARYAYAQLGKEYIGEDLKALCADLLRYGGQAQRYKGYRTDSLADSAMTEEHRAYLTDTEAVTFDSINRVVEDVTDIGVSWVGKSLLLDSKVTIRYVVDLSRYTGDLSALSLVIRYEDIEGKTQTATLTGPAVYNEGAGLYCFDFDGLLAAELRQSLSATVCVNGEPVTGTLEYSASTYGNGKTGTLGELCKCLMAYSDSARAYFAP